MNNDKGSLLKVCLKFNFFTWVTLETSHKSLATTLERKGKVDKQF